MTKPETKSNVYLFFGDDDFSLKRKIDLWKAEFAKKYSAQAISFLDGSELPEAEIIKSITDNLAPSLFASKKLIILRDCLPTKALQVSLAEYVLNLPAVLPKDFFVVFWQAKRLDGRLAFSKKFLKSEINITEFKLPHGTELNIWIKSTAKSLGVSITDEGADTLAVYLGRDQFEEKKIAGRLVERKEAYDLWSAFSEMSKLASATDNITPETVQNLVRPKVPDSVFLLSDSMASQNAKQAVTALENYLESATGDEKSAFIKIIGLLSEQFRSLLLVSLLQEENLDQQAMADKLGWSTGRVFVLTKIARNFPQALLKSYLAKLLIIDQKIKTSEANAHLLVDLFITSPN